jgi:hypothetical protein
MAQCPSCLAIIVAPAELMSSEVQCGRCGNSFIIEPDAPPPPPFRGKRIASQPLSGIDPWTVTSLACFGSAAAYLLTFAVVASPLMMPMLSLASAISGFGFVLSFCGRKSGLQLLASLLNVMLIVLVLMIVVLTSVGTSLRLKQLLH